MPLSLGQAVERYRTLGLAIEAAVSMDRWDEVDALLNDRDVILKQFADGQPVIDSQAQAQLKACDQRLLLFLAGSRDQAASGLRGLRDGSQMRRAYRPSRHEVPSFEKAG